VRVRIERRTILRSKKKLENRTSKYANKEQELNVTGDKKCRQVVAEYEFREAVEE